MKKTLISIFIVILFLSPTVFAAANPLPHFCEHQGYKYTYEVSSENKSYYSFCIFDDENKCDAMEFYRRECGQNYLKKIPCRKEGEMVFSQFEECCKGLEPSARQLMPWQFFLGQSICVEKLNFFQKLWKYFKSFFIKPEPKSPETIEIIDEIPTPDYPLPFFKNFRMNRGSKKIIKLNYYNNKEYAIHNAKIGIIECRDQENKKLNFEDLPIIYSLSTNINSKTMQGYKITLDSNRLEAGVYLCLLVVYDSTKELKQISELEDQNNFIYESEQFFLTMI